MRVISILMYNLRSTALEDAFNTPRPHPLGKLGIAPAASSACVWASRISIQGFVVHNQLLDEYQSSDPSTSPSSILQVLLLAKTVLE